ncbi:MAG: hypothetical protein IPM82_05950 [Saprospiraceae bacterium]|nr:hypothetical protein [Saprospiraceae bacterium]
MTRMLVFLMLTAASALLSFANAAENGQTCPEPTNLSIVSKSSGSIAFDWSDCMGGCNQYLVKYYRVDDDFRSQVFTVGNSDISFSGLPAGTYDFSFAIDCGSATGGWIVIEDVIIN